MTITGLKKKLAAEFLEQATSIAIENGSSPSRDLGELRFMAGVVRGLQLAAGMIEESIEQEDAD